jgi:hypothetical protein
MNTTPVAGCYEISPRFRRMIEERIERLERDAITDEINSMSIQHEDHMRRHLRLVTVQRAEALRMRLFLDKAGTRYPSPMIEK